MSGFFRLLSFALIVAVAFLLYQSAETKRELKELAARIESPQTTETTAPSWDDPDLREPYPETIPQQVASLLDAFEPLDGKYDRERIAKVVAEIDDQNLRDVLASIDWQSDIGKPFAAELIKRKAIDPEMFKNGGNILFRDLTLVRYCLTDPLCYEIFEKCCLSIKCCIHRYPCGFPCKACYPCWSRCCSQTIQIGIIDGVYKTVNKIRFEGAGVSVALDDSNSTIAVVTIPAATGGTGHTHGNLTTLEGITPTIVSNSHEHANQTAVDNLTQTVINDSHAHPNQAAIDILTQAATNNSHIHANQTAVDNLTQTVVNIAHEHANQAAVDGLSQAVIDNYHLHANQTAIDNLTQSVITHAGLVSGNPHSVAKSDVGLDNVDNVQQIPSSARGAASGVAALDASGNLIFGSGNKAKLTPTSNTAIGYTNCNGDSTRHTINVTSNMSDPGGQVCTY